MTTQSDTQRKRRRNAIARYTRHPGLMIGCCILLLLVSSHWRRRSSPRTTR